jgi:hypothetical protein
MKHTHSSVKKIKKQPLEKNGLGTTAVTGGGQWRTCHDWSKLEAWTYDNPGCFRYGDPNVGGEKPSQLAQMQYCPDDSRLLDRVREYFGKGSDRFPNREKYGWAQ